MADDDDAEFEFDINEDAEKKKKKKKKQKPPEDLDVKFKEMTERAAAVQASKAAADEAKKAKEKTKRAPIKIKADTHVQGTFAQPLAAAAKAEPASVAGSERLKGTIEKRKVLLDDSDDDGEERSGRPRAAGGAAMAEEDRSFESAYEHARIIPQRDRWMPADVITTPVGHCSSFLRDSTLPAAPQPLQPGEQWWQDTTGRMFLMQLPAILPLTAASEAARAAKAEGAAPATEAGGAAGASADAAAAAAPPSDEVDPLTTPFKSVEGGVIGHLVTRRSGRQQIRLANGQFFDVAPGISPSCAVSVYCVSETADGRPALRDLGPMARERLVVVPDIESLLEAANAESRKSNPLFQTEEDE